MLLNETLPLFYSVSSVAGESNKPAKLEIV